jgi:alpha-glucosidase
MSLASVPNFQLLDQTGSRLTLQSTEGHLAYIFVLEEDILRVVVLASGKFNFPRTWAIAPGCEDVPIEGRDRLDLDGFALPAFEVRKEPEVLQVATSVVRLTIKLEGLCCQWKTIQQGQWHVAASDRATQSYNFGWWDERVYHYLKRESDEMYFGLGERAGATNRAGQSYRMVNIDAMGYNARTTDPLYKHIPFYLTWKKNNHVAFGLFYDTVADCTFDLGRELDNYTAIIATSLLTMGTWTISSSRVPPWRT